MGSRSVSGWEDFSRNDESSRVGSKVLEEIAETVEGEKTTSWDDFEAKSDNTEKDGKDEETTNLDGFTSNGINGSNRDPISRDKTSARKNKVAHTVVV